MLSNAMLASSRMDRMPDDISDLKPGMTNMEDLFVTQEGLISGIAAQIVGTN